jgi:hypothetical protein
VIRVPHRAETEVGRKHRLAVEAELNERLARDEIALEEFVSFVAEVMVRRHMESYLMEELLVWLSDRSSYMIEGSST